MDPGQVIVARRCFKCRLVQAFSWNEHMAPTFEKPMELRATGSWYWNQKKNEHDIAEANMHEIRQLLDEAHRRNEPATLADLVTGNDQLAEGSWFMVHGKALCFRCNELFKAKQREISEKTLEQL